MGRSGRTLTGNQPAPHANPASKLVCAGTTRRPPRPSCDESLLWRRWVLCRPCCAFPPTLQAGLCSLCLPQSLSPCFYLLCLFSACPQDYARRRSAFGAPLIRQPLAQRTLGWLHLHTAASLALTLEVARLQGGWGGWGRASGVGQGVWSG